MTDTKRKYDAQMTLVHDMRLEPTTSNIRNRTEKESLYKNKRKRIFHPQMIFEIIERIKDL